MTKLNILDFDTRLESNYDEIRYNFQQELIDHWYSSHLVSEVDDGWDEYKKLEYDIYLENLS